MSCTRRHPFRFGPGAQLAYHHEQSKIRRKRAEDAQEKGPDVISFDFGFIGTSTAGEKTVPYLCVVDHVSGVVFAVLRSRAAGDYVIKAMVASVAHSSRTDNTS